MALLEIQSSNRASWRIGSRAGSLVLVSLFHAALLAVLVVSIRHPLAIHQERETIITFPPPPKKVSIERLPQPHAATRTPSIWIPPHILRPAPSTLNLPLTGCALESLANLPEDQRSRCALRPNLQAYSPPVGEVRNHAQQAQRWAAAIATRNSPVHVRCTATGSMPGAAPGAAATTVTLDMICLLKAIRDSRPMIETYNTQPN